MRAILLVFLAFCGPAVAAWAQLEPLPSSLASQASFSVDEKTLLSDMFVTPNELYPLEMVPHTQSHDAGLALSVGTERSFILASLNPRITGVIMVDVNRMAVLYNQVNIILLRLSKSLEDYRSLRFSESNSSWTTRAQDAKLNSYELKLMTNPNVFAAWQKFQLKDHPLFTDPSKNAQGEFVSANYLFDVAQFKRIKGLADARMLQALAINLTDSDAVLKLVETIKSQGHSVSIADISNARTSISNVKLEEFVKAIEPIATKNSRVLYTLPDAEHWTYKAAMMSEYRKTGSILNVMLQDGDEPELTTTNCSFVGSMLAKFRIKKTP